MYHATTRSDLAFSFKALQSEYPWLHCTLAVRLLCKLAGGSQGADSAMFQKFWPGNHGGKEMLQDSHPNSAATYGIPNLMSQLHSDTSVTVRPGINFSINANWSHCFSIGGCRSNR